MAGIRSWKPCIDYTKEIPVTNLIIFMRKIYKEQDHYEKRPKEWELMNGKSARIRLLNIHTYMYIEYTINLRERRLSDLS